MTNKSISYIISWLTRNRFWNWVYLL